MRRTSASVSRTDRPFFATSARDLDLLALVRQRQQRAGMAHFELALLAPARTLRAPASSRRSRLLTRRARAADGVRAC